MLTGLAILTAAAAVQVDAGAQRQQFVACLRTVVSKGTEAKMKPDGFGSAAKADCAAQINAFRSALVAVDVRNGRARKAAEADADMQIGDYITDYSTRLDTGS